MSGIFVTDALVLRSAEYGENDYLVTLLTPERGKVVTIAKGARSLRSRIRGGIQPYVYGNFEISEKGNMGWIRNVQIQEAFSGMKGELKALSLAAYLAELAENLSGEEYPGEELLRLTLNAFFFLSHRLDADTDGEGDRAILRVKAAYELRAMALSGYAPDLSACRECGSVSAGGWYLDVMNGSLICRDCLSHSPIGHGQLPDPYETGSATILQPLTPSALTAARYILSSPAKRVFSFMLPEAADLESLSHLAEVYVRNHLERDFDALRFFNLLFV